MILKTDLYQLSMILGYIEEELYKIPVTCEAFFRKFPEHRNLLVLSGIERATRHKALPSPSIPRKNIEKVGLVE